MNKEILELFKKNKKNIKEIRDILHKREEESKKEPQRNGYVYLLQEREFIKTGESIYKIGKTTRPTERFSSYPKGSIILLNLPCDNCHYNEKEIIKIFDEKFIQRSDIGREYYEGDIEEMCQEFTQFVFLFY